MFGTSDPPPEVRAAYERLKEGDGKEDMDMVIPFAYYHFGWPDDRFDEGIEVRGLRGRLGRNIGGVLGRKVNQRTGQVSLVGDRSSYGDRLLSLFYCFIYFFLGIYEFSQLY